MDTVLDIFTQRVAASGNGIALRAKVGGSWRDTSWNQLDDQTSAVAAGLGQLGVQPGDRVAILSQTRQDWVTADLAILKAGAVTVPIYPSSTPAECAYILRDSGSRVVFVEDGDQLAKLQAAHDKLQGIDKVVPFTGGSTGPWTLPLEALRTRGQDQLHGDDDWLADRAAAVTPDSLMTIVYTSGTTGPPKGVVLTHRNFVVECTAIDQVVDVGPSDQQLLFLPLAHIFAKVMMYVAIYTGSPTAFAESIDQLVDNIADIRPTWMGSVPRIYEKVYAKVTSEVERSSKAKQKIFDWSMKQGAEASQARQRGYSRGGMRYWLANKLVFSKLKNRFGGRLRFFVSGGAPLAKELAEFFHAADLLVLEAYGLTETTGATHINRPSNFRFGTVGQRLPGVEVQIAADGEILVRGENIMREYYNRPDATNESLDGDGWLRTGDIGEEDDEGFLRITDRKKDLIVTAGGKNIAPQNLENLLKQSLFISQVMVHGDKRKFLTAVICPDEETCRRQLGSIDGPLWESGEVRQLIEGEVARCNEQLAPHETIKHFILAAKEFEVGDELTPTMKVRRRVVAERYAAELDALYR